LSVLTQLWRKRKRHSAGSRNWLKAWTKRVYCGPELMRLAIRREMLRRRGALIGDFAFVSPRATLLGRATHLHLGPYSYIGCSSVTLHADLDIGSCVCINDGVTVLTASHDVADPSWGVWMAGVTVGDYAWIAQGATILPGVSIGRGAVVGAGAVVAKSVPDFAIAVGNPARLTSRSRVATLDYSPVASLFPIEAWLA